MVISGSMGKLRLPLTKSRFLSHHENSACASFEKKGIKIQVALTALSPGDVNSLESSIMSLGKWNRYDGPRKISQQGSKMSQLDPLFRFCFSAKRLNFEIFFLRQRKVILCESISIPRYSSRWEGSKIDLENSIRNPKASKVFVTTSTSSASFPLSAFINKKLFW